MVSWNLVVSGGVLKLEPPNFQDLELASDIETDSNTHSLDIERTPHKRLLASVWLTYFPLLSWLSRVPYAVLLWRKIPLRSLTVLI